MFYFCLFVSEQENLKESSVVKTWTKYSFHLNHGRLFWNNNQGWYWHQHSSRWYLGRYASPNSLFFFNWGGALSRGYVHEILHSTQLNQAGMRRCQRGRLRLLWYGSLLSAQMNPFWLWPGNHQAPPTLSSQPLMKKVQISSRSTHMLPLHIRQLPVWQQEAIAQIYVQKATDHFRVLLI